MTSQGNNSNSVPKPVAAAAGATDLAVEKIRDLGKLASDKLQSLEADPSTFADRVQVGIEARADTLGRTLRTASGQVREGAKDLSEKAQAALQFAFEQAGETYDALAKRGEEVVVKFRGDTGHEIEAVAQKVEPDHAPSTKKAAPKKSTPKATSATTKATTHRKTSRTTAK